MKRFSEMRGFFILLILSMAFGACLGSENSVFAEEEGKTVLRVLSFNIQIGRGPGGSYSDPSQAFLDRTAQAISRVKPDVACLQEVDNQTNRSGKMVDQLAVLGEKLAMNATFESKIPLPGGLYGIGILSHETPTKTAKALMKGSAHTRVLQICEFEKYVIFNTHLPLREDQRLEAVQTIEREAQKYSKPIILAGDFNAAPNSPVIAEFRKNWRQISVNAPTWPSNEPREQIDYVFLRNAPNATVLESFVLDEPEASDHLPVFCAIEF